MSLSSSRMLVLLPRVCIVCWALPLALGVLDFALWYVTRLEWLMFMGINIIVAGLVLLGVGAIALGTFVFLGWRVQLQGWLARATNLAALLFSNLGVAGLLIYAAEALVSQNTVVVTNGREEGVYVQLTAPNGEVQSFGPIAAHGREERSFRFRGEGEVRYVVLGSGLSPQKGIAFQYVTNGLGGSVSTISIGDDGHVNVAEVLRTSL